MIVYFIEWSNETITRTTATAPSWDEQDNQVDQNEQDTKDAQEEQYEQYGQEEQDKRGDQDDQDKQGKQYNRNTQRHLPFTIATVTQKQPHNTFINTDKDNNMMNNLFNKGQSSIWWNYIKHRKRLQFDRHTNSRKWWERF